MKTSQKNEIRTGISMIMVAIFASLLTQYPAHAYLDPGTGSYTAQMVLAGALVGVFSVRSFIRRIWDSVVSHFKKSSSVEVK